MGHGIDFNSDSKPVLTGDYEVLIAYRWMRLRVNLSGEGGRKTIDNGSFWHLTNLSFVHSDAQLE
jgi:hypothetical protein